MDSVIRTPAPDIQEAICSHRVSFAPHGENKYTVDLLCELHREHNGPAAILNLNNFSFKYKILFSILYWNEHCDDSIVTRLGST